MSKKKKRKRGTPPKFAVGGHVHVKPGVKDPDYPDMPLGGWAGTIAAVQKGKPTLYLLRWDPHTLDNIHPVYSKRCDRDGLDFEEMWLSEGDLAADTGEPVSIEQPVAVVAKPLSMDDQDDRIKAALGLTSDDPLPDVDETTLLKFHAHLAAHLKFPFEAEHSEETGPLEETAYSVIVLGLLDPEEDPPDEDYGIFCKARQGRRIIDLPLAELEPREGEPNHQHIDDYSSWFWDYR